jgi:hypothetical protein
MKQDWLTFAGLCVSCVTGVLAYLTKRQSTVTHAIVNSRFDALQAVNLRLLERIAALTGTADDVTRADVAREGTESK